MSVVAKMRLNSYKTTVQNQPINPDLGYTKDNMHLVEVRTLDFSAVTDGSEENKAFFGATPTGSISLGTVNPAVWQEFELNKEYYVTFDKAE